MPAVTPSSDQPSFAYTAGDVIAGKYALEQLLGEGGMGAVFRARNTTIDMPVAIKVIRAGLDRQQLTGRLLQEARAAAKLSHPAIVRVFDVGQTALGDPFIVMELLHGESLAEVIDRDGRVPPTRAVQLLLPIADGLAAAHAKGFVHRDVKPDNVFIAFDEEGQLQPKLVDFGIVKQLEPTADSQLTQVGSVLGSPEYMSPEQARGLEQIDARSDVWSFSIVLYEALSGATPFESSSYNALLRLIVERDPPTPKELAAADEALSAIVMRGLAKDPEQRWQSMTELGKALAGWLLEQGISADACGVSLQARWVLRQSDASALARAARSSSPDGWPEPLSGVRAVETWRERLARATPAEGGGLANAPTLHAAKQAGTPAPTADTAPIPRAPRAPWRGALLGLGGALVVGALIWLATRPRPAAEATVDREASGAVTAPAVAPTPPTTSAAASAPTPAAVSAKTPPSAEPTAAPPAALGSKPRPERTKLGRGGGKPHHAPATNAATQAAPKQAAPSDLLAPY